ncbi:MAG TPA: metallophosphoesterase [Geminicoccaceae bacterium]
MRSLLRFAVLADTHIEPEPDPANPPRSNRRARGAVEAINRLGPAFAIHLGDVAHPIPEAPWRAAALDVAEAILRRLACPLLITHGNHDIGDKTAPWMPAKAVRAEWIEAFDARFGTAQAVEQEGVRCVLLNGPVLNSGLEAEAAERARLEAVLEAGREGQRTFLLTHYPPWLLDPDEPGHYDNLDRPARDWLLELVRHHRVEALFAGHVHTRFRHCAGPMPIHVAPATSFTRRDYSELFRIGPAAEYGRDDAAKLGVLLVEVGDAGHDVRFHRLAEAETAAAARNDRLGVFVRHPLAEVVELPANPPTDALQRRRVRNDHPLLAVEELGLGVLRLPAHDLLDPRTRERMALLAATGRRFLLLGYGLPSAALVPLLGAHREMILGYEAVLDLADLARARAEPPALPVPLRLAPLVSSASAAGGGGQRAQRVGFGFGSGELDRLTGLDLKRDGLFAGIVARIGVDEPVFATLLRMVGAVSARELELSVDLEALGATPEQPLEDEAALATRAAEAAFAARALPDAEILLDSLLDIDRGYYPRHGLLDRRADLRAAGRAVRTIDALPPLRPGGFAWTLTDELGGASHGYESESGIELLVTGVAGARIERLRLPVVAPPAGRWRAVALDGPPGGAGRFATAPGTDQDVIPDPPPEGPWPLVVRLW